MPRQLCSVVWKEGQYYVARCLNIEVSSFGDTYESAMDNLAEAVGLYLEDATASDVSEISQPSLNIQSFGNG